MCGRLRGENYITESISCLLRLPNFFSTVLSWQINENQPAYEFESRNWPRYRADFLHLASLQTSWLFIYTVRYRVLLSSHRSVLSRMDRAALCCCWWHSARKCSKRIFEHRSLSRAKWREKFDGEVEQYVGYDARVLACWVKVAQKLALTCGVLFNRRKQVLTHIYLHITLLTHISLMSTAARLSKTSKDQWWLLSNEGFVNKIFFFFK